MTDAGTGATASSPAHYTSRHPRGSAVAGATPAATDRGTAGATAEHAPTMRSAGGIPGTDCTPVTPPALRADVRGEWYRSARE